MKIKQCGEGKTLDEPIMRMVTLKNSASLLLGHDQCCAILIGIGAKSVLKSKIFDTFGIVSVLVLKEVS